MAQILVVDDEVGIRELLSEILADEGHQVMVAESAGDARRLRERARPDLVLLDIWMPDTDGITLLKEWAASGQLTMPVVMMSGHGTIETAVEATRIGALDFLEKPIALQRLLATVKRALRNPEATPSPQLTLAAIGRSGVLADAKKRLAQLAQLAAPLMLRGERGMRAELFARLPALASLMLAQLVEARVCPTRRLAIAALTALRHHSWPGNLAELESVVKDLAFTTLEEEIQLHDVERVLGARGSPGALPEIALDRPYREAREAFERVYFENLLAREHGSMSRVAERSGLERTHLYRKLKALGLPVGRREARSARLFVFLDPLRSLLAVAASVDLAALRTLVAFSH